MEQKKLLIVTTVPVTIRAFLLPFADYFRSRGWRVDAMSRDISEHSDLSPHFDATYDMDWSRSPLSLGNFACAGKIARIVEDNGYDIVHVHTPVAAYVTRAALRKLRSRAAATGRPKVVYTAHGFHFYKGGSRRRNAIFKMLERRASRWTDRLVVINREDRAAARAFMPPEKVIYMPGIGLDFSHYSREAISREEVLSVRTEMGLKDDDVLFTMLAEFNPGKRHRDVIEALSRLRDTRVHVAFAGDGKLRGKIQDMARVYSVHQRVHFLGFVKTPGPLVAASRATLTPSEREGLSRSAMESVCLGVPVIGSDARGVRDVVYPKRGLLFPVGDPLALRDAMQSMADEPRPPVSPAPEWRIEGIIEMHERLYADLLMEAERERSAAARAEADRAERARIEAERRAEERRRREEEALRRAQEKAERAAEREEERRRRAEQKEIERRANEQIKQEAREARAREKEQRTREKIERELEQARAKMRSEGDEQDIFDRKMWKPDDGDPHEPPEYHR